MMESELPGSSSSSSLGPDSSLAAPAGKEKPIFTLKQMTLIAERMCKVRVTVSGGLGGGVIVIATGLLTKD